MLINNSTIMSGNSAKCGIQITFISTSSDLKGFGRRWNLSQIFFSNPPGGFPVLSPGLFTIPERKVFFYGSMTSIPADQTEWK